MPRSLGLLLTLRRVSALGLGVWLRAEPKLYRALSEDAWGSAVANMDAEGVRDHLRSWSWDQHSKPPGGFIEIVDILYRAGVDGRGLLFLRQSQKNGRGVADVRDLLQHEAVSTVAPSTAVIWQFLSLLETYPDTDWLPKQRVLNYVPADERVFTQNPMFTVTLMVSIIVICARNLSRAFAKYPPEDDDKEMNKVARLVSVGFKNGIASTIASLICYVNDGADITYFFEIVVCFYFAAIIFTFPVFLFEFAGNMSDDMLDNADVYHLQDAMKNNWTNTSVLSALKIAIVFSYGFPYDGEAELLEFPGGRKDV